MLTRIEIDGFKSFRGFSVDFMPFQVIVGPNAAGKSNLFDVLRLLSRLADSDLSTAFQNMRGEPREMFSASPAGTVSEMTLCVEALIDPTVRDAWGVQVDLKNTRIRYELKLARRRLKNGIERLYVEYERAEPIKNDRWPGLRGASESFRGAFVKRSRKNPWLDTKSEDGVPAFEISQDGHAGRKRPANAAESTNLSGVTSVEFPHLFALREELRSWRFLQLNPEALRQPSSALSPDRLTHDGSNLAAVLARIRNETRSDARPDGVLADVSAALAYLVPGVGGVDIMEDREKKEYRADVIMEDGQRFPSRVLSDGTLRILALVTLMHDPRERGLICFEEPENGVHPFRLGQVIRTLRSLATDPTSDDVDSEEPLKQVLMNSHSPVVLKNLHESEILFADTVSTVVPGNEATPIRVSRIRQVQRSLFTNQPEFVTSEYALRYLESVSQPELAQ